MLEGTGVAASAFRSAGEAVGSIVPGEVATNLVKDAFELPAITPPAIFMPLAGLVEAAQGDPSRLDQLWQGYKEAGLIPAVVEGDADRALEAIKEHPLFAALEVRGVQAAAGRTAGAVARRTPGLRQAGSQAREPIQAFRGGPARKRDFSPDLIEKGFQVLADRARQRRTGGQFPLTARGRDRIMAERVDRLATAFVGPQRLAAQQEARAGRQSIRRRRLEPIQRVQGEVERLRGQAQQLRQRAENTTGRQAESLFNQAEVLERGAARRLSRAITEGAEMRVGGRRIGKLDREGVRFALEGVIASRGTWRQDLAEYGQVLDRTRAELAERAAQAASTAERKIIEGAMRENRQTRQLADRLAREGNPDVVFAAARAQVPALRRTSESLEDLGPLDPQQAQRARAMPFAVAQTGARTGTPRRSEGTQQRVAQAREQVRIAESGFIQSERALATARVRERRRIEQAKTERGKRNARQRIARAERTRAQAKTRRNQARRELTQAERARRADRPPEQQLLDAQGRPLPTAAIERELRARGGSPEDLAFVSQSPTARGPRNFWRAFTGERASLPHQRRTGESTAQGRIDNAFDAVIEQRVGQATLSRAVQGLDTTLAEMSLGLRFRTFREGQRVVENPAAFGLDPNVGLRVVRIPSRRARQAEARRAEEIFDTISDHNFRGMEKAVKDLLEASTREGPGVYTVVPEQMWRRMSEHMQSATVGRRVAQVLKTGFTTVVLPVSPNWYLGNFIDINMRAMLSGTGLFGRDARLGRRITRAIEEMDPVTADRFRAQVLPGMLFGSAAKNIIHRDARQFAGTALAPLARSMGALRRTPGPREVVSSWVALRQAAFRFEERFIERQSQYALLGKTARNETRRTTGRMHAANRLGDTAINDLAKGLLKTENQIKFGKAIEETLGQWASNSPAARQFLVDYAPFGMWARASTRFVLLTLPAKHPIKTGIGAVAAEMTEAEREALGLKPTADNALPAFLQGSLPLPDGRLITPQTITSFGIFADYQQSLGSFILPQVPILELFGLDWKGDKLRTPEGDPLPAHQRPLAVLGAIGDAYIPFMAKIRQVADRGWESLIPRTLRPIEGRQTTGGGGGGTFSSGGGSGGSSSELTAPHRSGSSVTAPHRPGSDLTAPHRDSGASSGSPVVAPHRR